MTNAMTIPRMLLSVAAVAWATANLVAPLQAEEAEEGFHSIFDGRTLEGWDGDPKLWSVQDDAITGRTSADDPLKSNSFIIWTGGALRDFVLRLEFRIGDQGNSGIQYRSRRDEKAGKWVVGGYQADIDTTGRYLGILYEERGRGILAETGQEVRLLPNNRKAIDKFGERSEILKGIENNQWHEYEISARGNHLVQKINGRVTVDVTDEDRKRGAAEGILAFQVHVGPPMQVQFKDVRIKHFDADGDDEDEGDEDEDEDGDGDGDEDEGETGDREQETGNNEPRTAASQRVVGGRPQQDPPTGMVRQADGVSVLPGFRAERLYDVPSETQGSWVSLTVDGQGRLIASDQYGKIYRVTPPPVGAASAASIVVEPLPLEIGRAHGLLYAFDSLYVAVNEGGSPYRSGLYRVRDTDGDDQFDEIRQLRQFGSGGEHGVHAIIPSPDGKSLYLCGGNHCPMPELAHSRVPQNWDEDLLLPRMWDATGHARGKLAPGGWICRTDPEGREFELVSVGYRNEYDIAFNAAGDLFTYDADMEWDIGAPWYRPTRVCHATSGSEFGWRSGTGKWPEYYPDSLPSVVDVGPGSPTGLVFGYGAAFPARYQQALYLCDWSYGVVYAAHLKPHGSSYRAELERFAAAAPLPATDIVVNPQDGALYFTVGGRRVQSALYRVTYQGDQSTDPIAADVVEDQRAAGLRRIRHALEALHHPDPTGAAISKAWPYLGHQDRFIRFAARVAIEHQPVRQWQGLALSETDNQRTITAMIALARCGEASPPLQAEIVDRLTGIAFDSLSLPGQLELLRALSLAIIRLGDPEPSTAQQIVAYLNDRYPAEDRFLDRELCQLLVRLQAPAVVSRTMQLLAEAGSQESQIHYALCLRNLASGWTLDERRRYLAWFHQAAAHRGGHSFLGFLTNIRAEAIEHMSDQEREALAQEIADVPKPVDPVVQLTTREKVRQWSVEDLISRVEKMQDGFDYQRGRDLFAIAQCFKCHRVGGEGGAVGPDLTGVGRRFNGRDLLTAVLQPNTVISDQYRQTTFVVNGKPITGRVINLGGDRLSVNVDFLNNDRQVSIRRSQVENQFPSNISAMPEGLLDTFQQDEILQLLAYLKSGGDAEHPLFTEGG